MQESWAARRGERSGLIKKAGRQLIASSAGLRSGESRRRLETKKIGRLMMH